MSDDTSENAPQNSYGADSVRVLRGLEGVRMRPGMYIGNTDDGSGLHHLIYEVVDNSIDEALAGEASHVSVTLNADNSVTVEDDGRGIPVETHQEENRPAVEVIMTELHAGGKFDQNSYKVSGGLHGVGVSVVNALSDRLEVEVARDGKRYRIAFAQGEVVEPLGETGEETDATGTKVTFHPSWDVFVYYPWDADTILNRLRELAYLNAGIEIVFTDNRENGAGTTNLRFDGGVAEMVANLDAARSVTVLNQAPIHVREEREGVTVEAALEWTTANHEQIACFTNNIPQGSGGTHLEAFKTALKRIVGNYVERNQSERGGKVSVTGDDVREGINAVLSIKIPEPRFNSQTKEKLVSNEVKKPIDRAIGEKLQTWIDENPDEIKRISQRILDAAKAREAARKARDKERKKSTFENATLPGKLADCQSKKASENELFIVEGDSAGGSAKSARERKTQAILPLKGKILNVERTQLHKLLDNDEVSALINALGTGIGEDFNPEKLRYHKIVIMTDADVDGAHIRCLLLTFFHRHMPELIRRGHVYIAQPPLYRLARGKSYTYLKNEQEKDAHLIDNVVNDAKLVLANKENTVIQGDELRETLHTARDLSSKIGVLDAEIGHADVAETLAISGALTEKAFETTDHMAKTAKYLASVLNRRSRDAKWTGDVDDDRIALHSDDVGVRSTVRIPSEIMTRPAAKTLAGHRRELTNTYLGENANPPRLIFGNDEQIPVHGPTALFQKVIERGAKGLRLDRYKGLGEMNPDQLWETTLNPDNRSLLQVAETTQTTQDLFSVLMGSDTQSRRAHITEHATEVHNLDL